MEIELKGSWKELLNDEMQKKYFSELMKFVKSEYSTESCYPPKHQIFHAFDLCKLVDIKVVIIGQDPYHGINQANGLAFSVKKGLKIPPSLRNIYKELNNDLSLPIPTTGNLENWAKQGLLLLNATLTVKANEPGSHQKKGWETFTNSVIQLISNSNENVVFVLWGGFAQKKAKLIDETKHLILKSAHPSPLSSYRGFFGSKPFSKINNYLTKNGKTEIKWELESNNNSQTKMDF